MKMQNMATFRRELSQSEIVDAQERLPRMVLESWIPNSGVTITYWVKTGDEWKFRAITIYGDGSCTDTVFSNDKITEAAMGSADQLEFNGDKHISLCLWEQLDDEEIEQVNAMEASYNPGDLSYKLIEYHSFQEYAE